MTISLSKFDKVLNGRPQAREAFLRMQQILHGLPPGEIVTLDFEGVEVLTPSYAGELLSTLRSEYGSNRVVVINTAPAVQETLKALEEISLSR